LIWTYDRPTNSWSSELWEKGVSPKAILERVQELEEALAARQSG
jgi:predicted transcriptional regulator